MLEGIVFEVGEAYERQRERSSKLLAPLVVEFAGVCGEVLDVGCGTGALTFAIERPSCYYSWNGIEQHSDATQANRALCSLYALTGQSDERGSNIILPGPHVRPPGAHELSNFIIPYDQRDPITGAVAHCSQRWRVSKVL
jgi:SAM-dependent methyltransferase